MHKNIKFTLIGTGAVVGLGAVGAAILAATFNPNDYKPQIIRLVQEKKQRTLTIPGEIKLSFFPKIGVDLGRLSMSEHGSSAEFAAVDSARLSLALIPLLSKQFVVDQVRVDGLRARLIRFKDGSTNIDDLLSKDDSSQQTAQFDIDSVHVGQAHLWYDDRQAGRMLELSSLDLETGKIANGAPSKLQLSTNVKANAPQIDARLTLKTGFTLDLDKQRYVTKGLDLKLDGAAVGFTGLVLQLAGDADLQPDAKHVVLGGIKLNAAGKRDGQPMDVKLDIPQLAVTDTRVSSGKLSGETHLTQGARAIAASFSAPAFEGSPQAFKLPALQIDATVKDARLDAKAKISGALTGDIGKLLFTSPQLSIDLSGKQGDTALKGSLSTPLTLNLEKQLIDLPNIAADFALPNPAGGTLALKAGGKASVDLGKHSANASLKGKLDESSFDARLGLSQFSPATFHWDIGIDRLDLDRYLAPAPASQTAKAPAAADKTPEKPFDLSALHDLHADGSVRIASLKVKNLRTANVRFDVKAAGGKVDINPLSASLYGGSANGAMMIVAARPARFALRENLTGIDVGPLLKDALGKNPVEGKGNVQLDVSAGGDTVTLLRRSLNGSARLELRDGAVRGVNIAQAVRSAKAKLGEVRGDAPPQSGSAAADEKTDFSEMTASFRIANGIAHNDDLAIKSPLMRIAGSGDINLADERLDYLARATVVSTLQGQGGPDLQALKGLTVPVKLAGPFGALGWRVDFSGMARELAQQKLDEKKEEVRSQAKKAIDEQKGKAQEQLQEKLKGLLGR
jgi:AsmA protein